MAVIDNSVMQPAIATPQNRNVYLRLVQTFFRRRRAAGDLALAAGDSRNTKAALAISSFMILAWMTEVMEYARPGWWPAALLVLQNLKTGRHLRRLRRCRVLVLHRRRADRHDGD